MLLTTNDKKQWDEALLKLPTNLQDVYYSCDYYKIYENTSDSKGMCFLYEEDSEIYLYPFLKTKIKEDYTFDSTIYFDIEGAYGYNGPLSNSDDEQFLKNAESTFLESCYMENIIAEFTRFNPVLKNHNFANYFTKIKVNKNIVLDLSIDDIWMNAYEQSTRKNIKKAERNGLSTYSVLAKEIKDDEMVAFTNIYKDTMNRKNASDNYYFSETYFKEISRIVNNTKFYFTKYENKIVSCELVLIGTEIVYSFLGGTLSDYFNLRANDILKHCIINESMQSGLKYYCLGGGTTIEDGIFKYKKCFAKNGIHDFYIGKKIHNQKVYDVVINKWEILFPDKVNVYKNYLLKYKN